MGLNNFSLFHFFNKSQKEAWKSGGDLRKGRVQAFKAC